MHHMLRMIIQGELTSRLTHILFVPTLLFFTCNSNPSASEPPSYHQSSLPIVNALIEERPVRCLVASGTSITIVDKRILGPNQRFATERLKITDVNGFPYSLGSQRVFILNAVDFRHYSQGQVFWI